MSNTAINTIPWPPQYKVRRHRRAKYVRLHTTKKNGLEITIPYRYSLREIPAILEEYKSWIVRQLAESRYQPDAGLPERIELPAASQQYTLTYLKTNRKQTCLHQCPHQRLVITGDVTNMALCHKLLVNWAKCQAKILLPMLLKNISEEIQLPYSEVRIRTQKSQWGNCTSDKIITLNYRLIFLPEALVRHVLIHELCHTQFMDHSSKFWALVAKYDAAWQENKKLLKKGDSYIPAWA